MAFFHLSNDRFECDQFAWNTSYSWRKPKGWLFVVPNPSWLQCNTCSLSHTLFYQIYNNIKIIISLFFISFKPRIVDYVCMIISTLMNNDLTQRKKSQLFQRFRNEEKAVTQHVWEKRSLSFGHFFQSGREYATSAQSEFQMIQTWSQ